jgi:hypothetical protein
VKTREKSKIKSKILGKIAMRTFHVKELTQSNGKRNDACRPQPRDVMGKSKKEKRSNCIRAAEVGQHVGL